MKTLGRAIVVGLLISSLNLQAQSKKDLKAQLGLLEAQVDQLKKALIRVSHENEELKAWTEGNTEERQRIEVQYERCDRLWDTIDKQKTQIRQLEEELYQARLARAERKMPAAFKRGKYTVSNARVRDQLNEAYYEHYLSNCLRVSNIQRLFSEDVLIEFELNPVNNEFSGFLRHRYTPEMGRDEYSLQHIYGQYSAEGDFRNLKILRLDRSSVNILVRFEEDRELYNEISGSESDLALIATHYGTIGEFSFSRCR
ncbi:MAG: hypothetical protein RLP14_03890 [Owenweeksia sp.]